MLQDLQADPQLTSITVSRDRQPAGIHRHEERQAEPDLIATKPRWTWRIASMLLSRRTVTINSKRGIRRSIRCIIRQSKLT